MVSGVTHLRYLGSEYCCRAYASLFSAVVVRYPDAYSRRTRKTPPDYQTATARLVRPNTMMCDNFTSSTTASSSTSRYSMPHHSTENSASVSADNNTRRGRRSGRDRNDEEEEEEEFIVSAV